MIDRRDVILQPDFPYRHGVIAAAFKSALDGVAPSTLRKLAQDNNVDFNYIMVNLRKGSRDTPKRIGKRLWQWDLLESPTEIRVVNLKRTPSSVIGNRKY
jgi:hypothetical protein